VLEPAFKTAYLAVESIKNRKGQVEVDEIDGRPPAHEIPSLYSQSYQGCQSHDSYARVLRQQGKSKEARQVYAMCLQSQAGAAEADVDLRRLLVWEWAWMEYRAGAGQESYNVILLVANDPREGQWASSRANQKCLYLILCLQHSRFGRPQSAVISGRGTSCQASVF
jgi:hypothetical protein